MKHNKHLNKAPYPRPSLTALEHIPPPPEWVETESRKVFPVFLHGRSKQGMPVLWERIGKVDVGRADKLKLPLEALTPNYVFLNECVWRLVLDKGEDKNDDAKFITVEDVGGVKLWHLTPKVLSVLRALTGTMKAHYVERCVDEEGEWANEQINGLINEINPGPRNPSILNCCMICT